MLISEKYYFERLSELPEISERQTYLRQYLSNREILTDGIITIHKYNTIPVIEFYSMLSKKLHKIIREVLDNRPRPVSECIKTATSIITQATITLEKQFSESTVKDSNEFIKCVGLDSLSEALYIFFNTGESDKLQSEINRVREDILFIKNNNL